MLTWRKVDKMSTVYLIPLEKFYHCCPFRGWKAYFYTVRTCTHKCISFYIDSLEHGEPKHDRL